MTEPTMTEFQGDGVSINAALHRGGEQAILCLHGITANCRAWDVLASTLAPDYTIIAPDLRGRGRSGKPDTGYSPDHHVSDMIRLMDSLGLDQVILMGHSLGAFISLVFAARHPRRVQKLILVDGGGKLSPEQMEKVFQGIKPSLDRLFLTFDTPEAYMAEMKASPFVQPWQPDIEAYYAHEIEKKEDGSFGTNINPALIAEESENLREIDLDSLYPQIQCPCLILRADQGLVSNDDLLLPDSVARDMTAKIPNARCVDITGVNHYGITFQPHVERDAAIRGFLKS